MHFAALAYVGESVTILGRYYDVNVHGTQVLLEAMVRAGIGLILFSSSCAIYGEPDDMPIEESTTINPYGFTKYVCERKMDDFGRAHSVKSIRLRCLDAAGADPSAEIGEDHEPETHLIPLILDVALGRSQTGQRHVTLHHTWSRIAARMETMYESLSLNEFAHALCPSGGQ